ncbi:MAG: twin-arginine translocase subunit TatC [Bacteroidia bacterium]|nr:twin-arginine translocase subunit TatC [Bacteroidia bacterium]
MPLDQIDVDEFEDQMTFLEHLEALRWHLIRGIIAVVIGAIFSFINGKYIFDSILLGSTKNNFWTYRMLCDLSHYIYDSDRICIEVMGFKLQALDIQEQFYQHFMIAIIGGLIMAMPYLLYDIYRFIKPALKNSEKKYSMLVICFSSFLFFAGVLFGYYILSPISVNFLANYSLSDSIERNFKVSSVINFISLLTIGAGIIFELPIVVYFLSKIGLLTAETMKKYRRIAIIVILIISAIITPPDVMSQIILTFPILILYEIGIFIARKVSPKVPIETP